MITIAMILLFSLVAGSYIAIERYERYTITTLDQTTSSTIIVFGAGIINNTDPLPPLMKRLDKAAEIYRSGRIDRIIVSGDNRVVSYNEPAVMQRYLEENGVDPSIIEPDFAGRSTYETCERANKIFDVTDAILVTESSHLPRATYLCRHFGIEAIGIPSNTEQIRLAQRTRELFARSKAIFNVFVYGERTVL